MSLPVTSFSEDQAEAFDRVAEVLKSAGVDIEESLTTPRSEGGQGALAVIGKAGSGKTMLLARLAEALAEAGVETISGDYEGRRRKDKRTLAILAPTNKAASVLRTRGVPATTIHRILYTPVYDPEYEKIAEWLMGNGGRPEIEGLTDAAAGSAAKTRSISASSTRPPCSTPANTTTWPRSSPRFFSSATPPSWPR